MTRASRHISKTGARIALFLASLALAFATLLVARPDAPAQSQPARLALVIGNGAYTSPGWALANPPRDAQLMAERLRGLGFQVDLVLNADRAKLEAAMDGFGTKLKRAGPEAVSFFYYAGHGAQKDGANYLVPVDANAQTMDRLRFQSPPMQFLLDYMIETGNAVNVVVLDACRNLPLPEGQRNISGEGLADLGKPQNFFIAYATSPGRTASDGAGTNSPFTAALADALRTQAHEPMALLFSDVNNRVFRATEGGQSPEYRDGLVRAPRWCLTQCRTGDAEAAKRLAEAERKIAALTAPDRSELPPPPAPKTKPGESFKECPECPEMVVVPAGSFLMGSPATEEGRESNEAQHPVTIARPFAVGKFEVTFAEWDKCVAAGGCVAPEEGPYRPDDQGWGRGRRPVINVSWQDAKRYVRWLNGRVGGKAYRLLTEAEWEYAARAGTTTPFSFGATLSTADANYLGDYVYGAGQKGEWRQKTIPVGSFSPNTFGLHDLHGNVFEWVEDCYAANNTALTKDGASNTAEGCSKRVVRGGSWASPPGVLRSASRNWNSLASRYHIVGFRLARTVLPPAP